MAIKRDFTLDAKYRQEEGLIFLSGIQALVRLPLDQHRADKRRGLNTATLISGYRGSPLGGLDLTLERNPDLLRQHNVVFLSGVNEDLGATAVYGSQLANLFPQPKYDGVLGMWYGKGPGVDRTGDIFKHANFAGVGRNGGVLALGGDDPLSKSSTIPSHSEVAFYDALFPVLYPGSAQEILDLGRLGFELSRYSGLWVGFKIVTNVADEIGTAEVSPDRIVIADPGFLYEGRPWQARQTPLLMPPWGLEAEREIHYGRLEAAKAFAAANKLNRITLPTPNAWLGIAAPGKTYYDLREALAELGLDNAALRQYGIRLMQIEMMFPMEPGSVREFAQGLEELLVIEEKRAFCELFIRDILYNQAERPRVVGKQDEQGRPLVPADAELDADRIAQILASRLERRIHLDSITARVALLEALRQRPAPLTLSRQPYFCSGCPHNRSTVLPEGSMASAGIGCHGMALLMDRRTMGLTHMGGEGVQWVGIAPFTETKHLFQNLGDGTFFHSGSLAIRQAVASSANITYKILYNSAVAMTGGQDAAGAMPVPELTRSIAAEGVKRIIVMTDEPDKYPKGTAWPSGVEVWHRDRLDEAQRLLRDIPGVTALVYDQRCAAEKRRLRKRGRLPDPEMRVFINEAICEGCGDCGVKSNCLSVHPVETEFGRKTQIHQSSCNKDYSCLKGDCPSFLTVVPLADPRKKERRVFKVDRTLPEPEAKVPAEANVFMMGIGGTGVVTVNQILGTAALLDGKLVRGLDQTGLSQKGGPVVSHLKILDRATQASSKIAAGSADCYLGFDILVATSTQNLDHARPERTIAIVSTSQVPTGAMVTSTAVEFPEANGLITSINRVTRKDENVFLDALGLAETLFDDHMAANMIVLGAAWQAGALPVSEAAIEEAIVLNGVSVQMNSQAFRVGRLLVADPGVGAHGGPAAPGRHRDGGAGAVGAGTHHRGLGRRRGRAQAAPRDPRARADRLQERGLRARVRSVRPARARGRSRGRAGRVAPGRGGRALSLQADGLQGRVRSGAPLAQARHQPRTGRGVPRRGKALLQSPPADAPGFRSQGEAQARPVVRLGLPGAGPHEGAARHAARSLRVRRGAPGRAAAGRRVSGPRRKGAGRSLAGELRAGGEACRAARCDPRLRGDQAPQRPALPRRSAGSGLLR
jgi:indolepyruvate ferredoxin oxidoreductase